MNYKGYDGPTNRNEIIEKALNLFKKGDGRSLVASAKYDDPNWDDCPEVTLNISRKQDDLKGEHCLWVELPIHADDINNVWIYEKNFDHDDIENAINTFFKKVEDTERMFDVELEVWY